jgi:hypothetical protein
LTPTPIRFKRSGTALLSMDRFAIRPGKTNGWPSGRVAFCSLRISIIRPLSGTLWGTRFFIRGPGISHVIVSQLISSQVASRASRSHMPVRMRNSSARAIGSWRLRRPAMNARA